MTDSDGTRPSLPPGDAREEPAGTLETHGREGAEQAIWSFARKLDAFASGLSEKERRVLSGIVLRAMGPLERMRWTNAGDVLTEEERQVLRSLSDTDG